MKSILGPRGLQGILGETFKIYGKNFLRLLVIVAIVLVPMLPAIETEVVKYTTFIVVIGMKLLFTVLVAFLYGALIHAVSEQYLRQTIDIGRAYRFAWGRLWAMAGAFIFIFLLIHLGGYLVGTLSIKSRFLAAICFLPVIYFKTCWALALQAALLEGLGPIDALSRSSALVRGNWWRVLGILLVLFLIVLIIRNASFYLRGGAPVIATIIVVILAFPIATIGMTLLYYDLRVRKEGYNLDSLATELHIKMDGNSHEKNL